MAWKKNMDESLKSLKLIIEALLFASEKPIMAHEIHNRCLPDESLSDIKTALKELQAEYDLLGRSFVIKEIAQGYQFRTRSGYSDYILRILKSSSSRLSQAALETLAIIAYKQPILRQEIERLRGVDAGGILRSLMEKNMVRIMGRKNLPGRPLIYGTTKKFLEIFELKGLDSLPNLKEIKEIGSNENEIFVPEKKDQAEGNKQGTSYPKKQHPGGNRQSNQT